jgi:hypothetical protein
MNDFLTGILMPEFFPQIWLHPGSALGPGKTDVRAHFRTKFLGRHDAHARSTTTCACVIRLGVSDDAGDRPLAFDKGVDRRDDDHRRTADFLPPGSYLR